MQNFVISDRFLKSNTTCFTNFTLYLILSEIKFVENLLRTTLDLLYDILQ